MQPIDISFFYKLSITPKYTNNEMKEPICVQDVTAGASYQRGGPCQLRVNRRAWPSQAPVGQFLCQSGAGTWRIRKPVRPQTGPTLGLLRRVWAKRGRVRLRSRPQQPTKRPWLCNRGVNTCKSLRWDIREPRRKIKKKTKKDRKKDVM